MGLTSPALIALLAVLSGLLMACAVGFWPKLARPGPVRIAGRIVLVGALDVVAAGLILAIANQSGGFYASWSELFGTEHVSGHIIAVARGPVAARTVHGHDGELTVTSRLAIAVPGHPRIRGGRLLTVTMTGPVSGISASGYVYAPRAARRMTASADLPVIVVISDRLGATGAAFSARRIARTAAGEIGSGRLRPVLIVMLPARIAPGAGRTCLDVPDGPQAATFFTQDLPRLVRSGFPVSDSSALWAVAGDRTGAYCALQLVLTSSATYSVAAAPAGYYTPQEAPRDVGPSQPLRRQENLIYLLGHQPMQPVSVLLSGGYPAARPILALARPPLRVTTDSLAGGELPVASVLYEIGRLLGTQP